MMNKKKVFWTLMFLLVFSLLSVVVFARPPQVICCGDSSNCVIWDRCVASGYTQYDVDGDGDKDYCQGGTGGDSGYWWDCWTAGESAACGDIDVGTHGVPNIKAQYCDGNHDCQLKIDSLCGSCTKNYECDTDDGYFCDGGYCKTALSETGALCSDGLDNDCDWTLDCADDDCVGDSACCGSWGADCCSGSCDSGLYCTPENHCCNPTQKWSGTQCVGTTQCNPGSCPYEPFTTNWWLTDGCFLIPTNEACCNVGLKYGEPNYYDYEDADGNINVETY